MRHRNLLHRRLLSALVIVATLAGCLPKPVAFMPNKPIEGCRTRDLKVAVAPFELYLPSDGDGMGGVIASVYIPFWFYTSWQVHEDNSFYPKGFLDPADRKRYEELLAEDLAESGIFRSVSFVEWKDIAAAPDAYDLVLTGRFHYDRRDIAFGFYGLSIAGVLLSYLGIPSGGVSRDVSFDLHAFTPLDPSHRLWEKQVRIKDPDGKLLFGLYGMMGIGSRPPAFHSSYYDHFRETTPALLRGIFTDVRKEFVAGLEDDGKLAAAIRQKAERATRPPVIIPLPKTPVAAPVPPATSMPAATDEPAAAAQETTALVERGDAAFDRGEFKTAIELWSKALALDPGNSHLVDKIRMASSALKALERQKGR